MVFVAFPSCVMLDPMILLVRQVTPMTKFMVAGSDKHLSPTTC
jgi:hypothetical protein